MSDPIEELRALSASASPPPPALAGYLAKVRNCAHTMTDADVSMLKQRGFSEDEIFEQTVATAIDEGLRRLDAALAAIR